MMRQWISGLLRFRFRLILGAAFGVALSVALLAVLGVFISQSIGTMTSRAISTVSPDWQIQLAEGADPNDLETALSQVVTNPLFNRISYADVTGFTSETDTVQQTGRGKVVGITGRYFSEFPTQFRLLAGNLKGNIIAQQTAANLHVAVGDTINVQTILGEQIPITIDGIVEMPKADQFFQVVSVAMQTAITAPPDNVLLIPMENWDTIFKTQLERMPQTAFRQIHASFDLDALTSNPADAANEVAILANSLTAKASGTATIGNNLEAKLNGVREDALFAKVLFLFLGVPGAFVAALLMIFIVNSSHEVRRKEIGLLQIRGANRTQMLGLVSTEGLLVGVIGAATGIFCGELLVKLLFNLGGNQNQLTWVFGAGVAGFFVSFFAFFIPVSVAVKNVARTNTGSLVKNTLKMAVWRKYYVDALFLLASLILFWQSTSTGYNLVVAPEGVATAVVDYKAFITPFCFWIGSALFIVRFWLKVLENGRQLLAVILKPISGNLNQIVSAFLVRDRDRLVKGIIVVALSVCFSISSAIFNTTYENQAKIDAKLTNGADVTLSGTINVPIDQIERDVRAVSGVVSAEPLQHRLAYVGNDLQDLYGINPALIAKATEISDAYFENGNAQKTLLALAQNADGVLVSAETVNDFQLKQGDRINIRLQTGADLKYAVVPFKFVGIVREFPTAPKDSFLVANAKYIEEKTGIATSEVLLVKSSINPALLASNITKVVPNNPAIRISDISAVDANIGSSLVSFDLHGLMNIELLFAFPLIGGALGIVFFLGATERRHTFSILFALGASPKQVLAFLWSEALIVFFTGILSGSIAGLVLSWGLVKMTTQVFDPPPETLFVPWLYLLAVFSLGLIAVIIGVLTQLKVTFGKYDLSDG